MCKTDYMVLDGTNGNWDGFFLEWQIPAYFFKHLGKDDEITVCLKRCQFIGLNAITDPIMCNCEIITDLPLLNQSNTNNAYVLDIVDIKADTINNAIVPLNNGNDFIFNVSKFNSIKIGVLFESNFINLSSSKTDTKFILKIEY